MAEHWDTIAAGRLTLADQLEGLTAEQWASPSLCSAWTVRDVVAHLVVPHEPGALPRFLLAFVTARGSFHRTNRALAAREARRPTADLVGAVRRSAPSRFHPPGFGSEAPLTDLMVHTEDIAVPLGLADPWPAADWRPVLDLLVTAKARTGFVAGRLPALRYRAVDIDWSHGPGSDVDAPEVTGPAAALALTMLGRPARLAELTGPGAATLVGWAAG